METEKPKKTAWEKFAEFGKGWGLIVAFISTAVGLGVMFETRIFTDGDMRYQTEQFIKESPNAETRQRDRILDSLNKTDAIRSRKVRDSLFIRFGDKLDRIEQRQQIQDSLNVLNADQIFQIKEEIKGQ